MTIVARLNKNELDELRIQQHSVSILKNQANLAQRGFSAKVGEVLRRYRRVDDERLFIDFSTGDVKIYETPRDHLDGLPIEKVDTAPSQEQVAESTN